MSLPKFEWTKTKRELKTISASISNFAYAPSPVMAKIQPRAK
jgi:hypothetical protein